jgi:hypothetical protein
VCFALIAPLGNDAGAAARTGNFCPPRHRLPFNSIIEGSNCESAAASRNETGPMKWTMNCRAISARP